jgi:microcystin-dependent protein
MSTPYLGQLKIVAFGFAPKGWAMCNGQLLPINQNQALFSLLGTTYGGNGTTTFALPNLQGRAPIHAGNLQPSGSYQIGDAAGETAHTLIQPEMPAHTHELVTVSAAATAGGPGPIAKFAGATTMPYRTAPASLVGMNSTAMAAAGSSQPHENRQPYLAINYIVALQGIFPSRN